MARVIMDPLTRIEGHLRVEVEVGADNTVSDAWVSGTLYRGMETVLKNRRPQDAFYVSQRICGVCPISHGHASTMSAENTYGLTIPNGARLVRNIIECAQYLHSHVLWFYTLGALDYVDPVKALSANIADTYDLAQAAGTTTADFGAVANRVSEFVNAGLANNRLSIFTNGWFGHPAYAANMPAELHLIAVAHYLEALHIQAEAAQVMGIMGGKFPHFMTSVNGGTTFVPTEEKLDDVLYRMTRVVDFVNNTMIPDTLAIAPFYLEAAGYGAGCKNYLSWGVFNSPSFALTDRYLPGGVIKNLDLAAGTGLAVEAPDPTKVKEYVERSWYDSQSGLNPADGETSADYVEYDVNGKYSWGKAVRYDDMPMEVGPLSRMLVGYLAPSELPEGVRSPKDLVDFALAELSKAAGAQIPLAALQSLLGRVAARNLEAAFVADLAIASVLELVGYVKDGDTKWFEPHDVADGKGVGLWEAPRGSVAHWMTVEGGKLASYQVVAPTTWDIAPRDKDGTPGPMEQALIGAPVMDAEKPMEIVRIARSFDP
ncbi:MAG: nickel-dependent hydrogenase large subunit [Coriobacteriia bacterium]|nr:nickel-dependent hydrogenase large subunit [Coriobacteriia bacterium]